MGKFCIYSCPFRIFIKIIARKITNSSIKLTTTAKLTAVATTNTLKTATIQITNSKIITIITLTIPQLKAAKIIAETLSTLPKKCEASISAAKNTKLQTQ